MAEVLNWLALVVGVALAMFGFLAWFVSKKDHMETGMMIGFTFVGALLIALGVRGL